MTGKLRLEDLRVEWTYPQGASELGGYYEGTRSRPATIADWVEVGQQLGAEIRYRPNGDKLLVIKLKDGHPPEPVLPEPLDYLPVESPTPKEGEQ